MRRRAVSFNHHAIDYVGERIFAMNSKSALWKRGVRDGVPIFLGYVAVSFTFSIAAQKILTPLQAVIMSATNYTSAGQFAALGLIAASAPLWEMAGAQLVINLRYSLMSCSISQKLESATPAWHRFVMAMGLTDEVFGLSATVKGRLSPFYMYGVMTAALPGWVLGTFLGMMSSGVLPPRIMSAMGIAIYGMFIAIIFPPVRENRRLGVVIAVSMACSVLCDNIPLLAGVTPGMRLIGLTLLLAGAAALLFPLRPDELRSDEGAPDAEGAMR